jgi:hypothetical protein
VISTGAGWGTSRWPSACSRPVGSEIATLWLDVVWSVGEPLGSAAVATFAPGHGEHGRAAALPVPPPDLGQPR